MNQPKQSRGTQLDPQKLSEASGNLYNLVIQASLRAYQIRRGSISVYSDGHPLNSAPVTALLEIQNG